jgi:DNA-binding transcriptional MerR regulator
MARSHGPDGSARGGLLVGELAAALGVTAKTLRFYEKEGVVPPPARTAAGYRVYSPHAVRRARMAVTLRSFGFSVEAVRALLTARDGPTLRTRLMAVLDERIGQAMLDIAVLQGRREEMEARLLALFALPAVADADAVGDAFLGRAGGGEPEVPERVCRPQELLTLP